MDDLHVMPNDDERTHQETRRCWCEPEIKWPCGECPEVPNDKCFLCGGTGFVTKPNGYACVVVHDAKDGRE